MWIFIDTHKAKHDRCIPMFLELLANMHEKILQYCMFTARIKLPFKHVSLASS